MTNIFERIFQGKMGVYADGKEIGYYKIGEKPQDYCNGRIYLYLDTPKPPPPTTKWYVKSLQDGSMIPFWQHCVSRGNVPAWIPKQKEATGAVVPVVPATIPNMAEPESAPILSIPKFLPDANIQGAWPYIAAGGGALLLLVLLRR